jgi:hypothetical protein
MVRRGVARQAWIGAVGHGSTRPGVAGMVRQAFTLTEVYSMAKVKETEYVTAHQMRNREWKDALEQIRLNNPDGLLLPLDVVKAAKSPKHCLHGAFTWDVKEAAEKWWLEEARALIRVVVESHESNMPAFVSLIDDRSNEGGGYRSTPQVLSSAELSQQLLNTALTELRGWMERHKMIKGLVSAVGKAAGIIDKKPHKKKARRERQVA